MPSRLTSLGRDAQRQRMLLLVNQLVPQIRDHTDPEGRREGFRAPEALEESNSSPPPFLPFPSKRAPAEEKGEGPRLRGASTLQATHRITSVSIWFAFLPRFMSRCVVPQKPLIKKHQTITQSVQRGNIGGRFVQRMGTSITSFIFIDIVC